MKPLAVSLTLAAVFALVAPVRGQPGPADSFDREGFLSRNKWYLSFTLSLRGAGETNRPDGDSGYDKLEWNIHREVSGVIELGKVMPGQFPGRHFPKDPAAMVAALSETGRYIGWGVAPPKGQPAAAAATSRGKFELQGNPRLVPVTYVVSDTLRSESLSYGEGRSATRSTAITQIQGSGSAYMSGGTMLACDLKDMMVELDVEGARAALGFKGENPDLKTQQETHSFEESLGVSEDQEFPLKTAKPDSFLPGMTETMKDKVGWQRLELRQGKIAFTVREPVAKLPFGFDREKKGGPPLELTMDVTITPSPPSRAKLLVMPRGYNTWRPKCSHSESTKGNELQVEWRIEEEGGDAGAPTEVRQVVFSMANTSREPGVCLNYPLQPKTPADFDLKFGESGGLVVTPDGQRLTISKTQASSRKGVVTVECFDAGAWSDVSVRAELADGRTLIGHLESDPAAITIALPKRTGASRIADAWKEQHGVTALGDNDDSEKLPSAAKVAGDGFTLYEEYRGFVVNGAHIEGDPKKIDFFVRNYIGGDARPGIDLFACLTGAEVHDRLRDVEFDAEKRVMNANHDRGPHRVDQHGVYLRTQAGLDGAAAIFSTGRVRGRPRLCLEIRAQPRGALTSVTTSENLPASELVFAYDRAIAHELLHSVGVEHHGDSDYRSTFHLIFADDPRNKSGKPVFSTGFATAQVVVSITDERSGRDLAEMLAPDLMLAREHDRAKGGMNHSKEITKGWWDGHRGADATATTYSEDETTEILYNDVFGCFHWYVGAQHGECSGDENCVSRYYFAKLYQKQGVAKAYYYISDRQTERAGLGLCRSRTGTGINAAGRKPQPRYGNSTSGWADCANWIVFNDAAPDDRAPAPPPPKR